MRCIVHEERAEENAGLRRTGRSEADPPMIGMAVHGYYPQIGGSEIHVRWLAEALLERGELSPLVVAPRGPADPGTVSGVRIVPDPAAVASCDAVFTYTVSDLTQEVAALLRGLRERRPVWLHHPCAVEDRGFELIRGADRIVAFNDRDVELTELLCGSAEKVARIRPGAHPERRGRSGRFQRRVGSEYILWVGAWEAAKGVASLSRRFAILRERRPDIPLKLVMFGGYGEDEWPVPHPDIMIVNQNEVDVPDALADCLFLAFNSAPHPLGHDANPLILLESLLNGKTFLAQAGTPFLAEVHDLGVVVETDEAWLRAAEMLILDRQRRRALERACRLSAERYYTLEGMVSRFETAVLGLLATGGSTLGSHRYVDGQV